jgi:hypothetical protein
MINLTSMQLAKAASIKQDIEALEQELHSVLGNGQAVPVTRSVTPGKKTISEAGKARIAAAQRKRWAKFRKASR